MSEWKFFVLGQSKTPLPNCAACRNTGPEHDREACPCLTCHGFYAAKSDPTPLAEMRRRHPTGHWAVRTGAASDIIVIDAEGVVDERSQCTGVEVLDDLESWTRGVALPRTDLIASTPSGGVHRYYRYVPGIRSRNRILPGVDLKSDGGYVLVPETPGREWISYGTPGHLGVEFERWLAGVRGARGIRQVGDGVCDEGADVERPEGYDYKRFLREGCPGGSRDEFFNELLFRMRKAGVDRGLAVQQARIHWKRCGQPGVPPGARWYMPWHHVEGKMDHVWRTVEPDNVSAELQAWADAVGARNATPAPRVAPLGGRRVGAPSRVTVIRWTREADVR